MDILRDILAISPEVQRALEEDRPVVALESTDLSHGMPYPQSAETLIRMCAIVRENSATPAVIAVLGGVLRVGLSNEEIDYLAQKGSAVQRASRRDLPVLMARGMDGTTTVAATMILAALAGAKVFATGGIGGVHRGSGMDISADLEELGRTPTLVVCSGVKSVLDIGGTLEYLETRGVPVLGFGTEELPSFYTRESGFAVDYRIDTAAEAARIYACQQALGLQGGVLVGNPIPAEYSLDPATVAHAIDAAMQEAAHSGIADKQLTPFLLERIEQITGGKSLEANIHLLYANAKLAAEIACALI